MIEFLNYVPIEGSVGELLMNLIPLVLIALSIWLVIREIRKSMEDC